jgi:hypothetical protein
VVLTNRKKSNDVSSPKSPAQSPTSVPEKPSFPDELTIVSSRRIPALPVELWRQILSYVARLFGANAAEREDPFGPWDAPSEFCEPDAELFEDRMRLLTVCRTWHSIVLEIMAEYIIICCDRHLLKIVDRLELSRANAGGHGLGQWTRRIDFRMYRGKCTNDGHLTLAAVDNVVRLLRCTPNLMIYINDNNSNIICETPSHIIYTLVTHCKSLQRVEWNGPSERPSWSHLSSICCNLPNLRTLRISHFPPYPPPPCGDLVPIPSTHLRTLSFGPFPRPSQLSLNLPRLADAILFWQAIWRDQLPSLESLEVSTLPDVDFFRTHGHKIRRLRITSWSTPSDFPVILQLCSNLQDLTLSLKRTDHIHLPSGHPTLQRICILPFNQDLVRVPSWLFSSAVLGCLDHLLMTIENMDLPELVQVRIRNVGAFTDLVDYSVWLKLWWRRWNIRGVRFEDKTGKTFESACPGMYFQFSSHQNGQSTQIYGQMRICCLIPCVNRNSWSPQLPPHDMVLPMMIDVMQCWFVYAGFIRRQQINNEQQV